MKDAEGAHNHYLAGLFETLQSQLVADLRAGREAFSHPGARGDSSEANWRNLLARHLPHRYCVAEKATVCDWHGHQSDQIDIVIYDRQYTPIWYDIDRQQVIPAESVYAIFEAKQTLNRDHVQYAANKAASVRRLDRTSAVITHAGGSLPPRPPIAILAGILTYLSDWAEPFGVPLREALMCDSPDMWLNLGCIADCGSFEAEYAPGSSLSLRTVGPDRALAYLLLRLLHRLQSVGTVTAIDYDLYSQALDC